VVAHTNSLEVPLVDPELIHNQMKIFKKDLPAWNVATAMDSRAGETVGKMVERLVELLHGCGASGTGTHTKEG
jgi:hypothetical protein